MQQLIETLSRVSTAAYQASGSPDGGAGGFDGSSPNGEAPEGAGSEAGDETVEGEFKEV
jgi:hypothetical protein